MHGERLLLAVALVIASGCSTPGQSDTGGEATVVVSSPLEQMPLGHFLVVSSETQRVVDLAIELRTIDCMRENGFSYTPMLAVNPDSADYSIRRYGAVDEQIAASFGYGMPPSPDPARTVDSPSDLGFPDGGDELTRFTAALFGEITVIEVPDPVSASQVQIELRGGCIGSATLDFFGSIDRWSSYAGALVALESMSFASYNALLSSPEYESVESSWFDCMADNGENRFAAPTDPTSFAWPEPHPGVDEIATARLDTKCKRQVDFVAQCVAFEAEWQSEQPELLPYLEQYQDAVTAIKAALSGN